MATAQSPIKVYESTKDRVRHAALLSGCNQAELVDRAVSEYVERHRDEFASRMDQAREALLGGKASTLAYTLGVSEADVERVGGVADQRAASRKPKRATSNQASSPPGQSARGSQSAASAASKTSRKSTSRSRSSTKRPSGV